MVGLGDWLVEMYIDLSSYVELRVKMPINKIQKDNLARRGNYPHSI